MNNKKAKQIRAALKDRLDGEKTSFITKKSYNKLKFKTTRASSALKYWNARYKDAKRMYKQANVIVREHVGEEWREAGYYGG